MGDWSDASREKMTDFPAPDTAGSACVIRLSPNGDRRTSFPSVGRIVPLAAWRACALSPEPAGLERSREFVPPRACCRLCNVSGSGFPFSASILPGCGGTSRSVRDTWLFAESAGCCGFGPSFGWTECSFMEAEVFSGPQLFGTSGIPRTFDFICGSVAFVSTADSFTAAELFCGTRLWGGSAACCTSCWPVAFVCTCFNSPACSFTAAMLFSGASALRLPPRACSEAISTALPVASVTRPVDGTALSAEPDPPLPDTAATSPLTPAGTDSLSPFVSIERVVSASGPPD